MLAIFALISSWRCCDSCENSKGRQSHHVLPNSANISSWKSTSLVGSQWPVSLLFSCAPNTSCGKAAPSRLKTRVSALVPDRCIPSTKMHTGRGVVWLSSFSSAGVIFQFVHRSSCGLYSSTLDRSLSIVMRSTLIPPYMWFWTSIWYFLHLLATPLTFGKWSFPGRQSMVRFCGVIRAWKPYYTKNREAISEALPVGEFLARMLISLENLCNFQLRQIAGYCRQLLQQIW